MKNQTKVFHIFILLCLSILVIGLAFAPPWMPNELDSIDVIGNKQPTVEKQAISTFLLSCGGYDNLPVSALTRGATVTSAHENPTCNHTVVEGSGFDATIQLYTFFGIPYTTATISCGSIQCRTLD